MTPDAINRAIAAAVMPKYLCKCGGHWRQSDGVSCGNSLPNYHGSLAAMHEAENYGINATNEACYRGFLVIARGEWTYHRATAQQRAEAYLRTIGKWEDNDAA
tara:strand:+ start:650 stop:958 length:309 start_codon:yes stop_codon:yes gene_type:complete